MEKRLVHTCGKLDTAQAQYDISCGSLQCGDVVQMSQSGAVEKWNIAEIMVFGIGAEKSFFGQVDFEFRLVGGGRSLKTLAQAMI